MASMFCNVGPVERIVRLAAAGAAAVPVINGRQPPQVRKWLAIGAIAELFTAFSRFCPLNLLLGIDNCPRRGVVGSIAYRGASLVPGGRLAYGALEALGSAAGTVGGAAAAVPVGVAKGVVGGAASGVASGATSAAKAFASEEEDDDEPGDNVSMLIAGFGALAIAAGMSFALNSTRTAQRAAAASTVRPSSAGAGATESLGATLRGAMNAPEREASNTPG